MAMGRAILKRASPILPIKNLNLFKSMLSCRLRGFEYVQESSINLGAAPLRGLVCQPRLWLASAQVLRGPQPRRLFVAARHDLPRLLETPPVDASGAWNELAPGRALFHLQRCALLVP